ncbi:aldehyde dehydrogenase [Halalkalibacter wakoensis JCM 9140]|uniref:Aldehyde dehydrogenase n=1 Tax=Halalkalibacter wakoensis JCM 9140 TaxID=1236970 RepID=W4Q3N7_9BACI|nr:aldehyde dehydrogenase family protein [Halalkalibacter wakoensis]GAE25964.1 aldehyde dehydrogenase [Halalkalibacter wakoensis JCM 9140]
MTTLNEWLEGHTGQTHKNFINGEWVKSLSQETFEIYNPAQKNQVLGFFQASVEEDVNAAVESAHEAFKSWSQIPGPDRGAILMRFADLLEKHSDEVAFILSAEQGKVLAESKGEVGRAVKETRFIAGEALRIEGSTLPSEKSNISTSVLHTPLGVVAAIAPWNFPVVTPVRKIAPALAYGCTVVYKPASETPWSSVRLMELFKEAGVPNGVVNLVTGGGSKVGNPLITHPLVKGISFTGSTEIGLGINEKATRLLKKTQLELGGKNPAVVVDYSDVDYVAKQIVSAAFACSGQRCTSISRVVVLKEKAEEVTQAIRKELEHIKVGPASDNSATIGPLVSQDQLDTTTEYIKVGKEEGATLAYGGDILAEGYYADGHYIVPSLFTGVKPEMRIATEEIFGPVLSIIEVENVDEAISVANNVKYGLAASIFTNDLSLAYRFVNEVESGMVHVNHGTASQAHAPFGGVKESGYGAFSIGKTNKDFFTEMKVAYFQY